MRVKKILELKLCTISCILPTWTYSCYYSLFFSISKYLRVDNRCIYFYNIILISQLYLNNENVTKYIFKEAQVLLHITSYLCACPARRDKIIYIREIAFEIKQALNERRLGGKFFSRVLPHQAVLLRSATPLILARRLISKNRDKSGSDTAIQELTI